MLRPLFLCLIFAAVPLLRADITPGKGGPRERTVRAPVANDTTVNVVRGQTVEIKLTGNTSTTKALMFHLRTAPALGVLAEKEPLVTSKTTAVVHYTADPAKTGAQDRFTFATQVEGSPASNTATVTIHIADTMARLVASPVADAGKLFLGKSGDAALTIENTGNGAWQAKVAAPAGWSWREPRDGMFHVPPSGSVNAILTCHARTAGVLDETIALFGSVKVRCTARVLTPFAVMAPRAVLEWKPATLTRAVSVDVQNNTPEPLVLSMDGPPECQLPGTLEIPAGGKVPLSIVVSEKPDQPVRGGLVLLGAGHRVALPVEAEPAPALVKIVSGPDKSGRVDFGKLDAATHKIARREVVLQNVGGTGAMVRGDALTSFRMTPEIPAGGLRLPPGGELKLSFLPPRTAADLASETLALKAGTAEFTMTLTCEIDPSVAPAADAGTRPLTGLKPVAPDSGDRTHDEQMARLYAAKYGFYVSDGTEDESVPRIDEVVEVDSSATSVTVAWDMPEGEGWKFRLMRVTAERTGDNGTQWRKIWVPYEHAEFSTEGRRVICEVSELPTGRPAPFRIQTISPHGKKSFPGREVQLVPREGKSRPWLLYLAIAAAVVLLARWLRKKWKQPISSSVR